MKKKWYIWFLFVVILFLFPSYVMANNEIGTVFVHEGPDGTVSFIAQNVSSPFSVPINVVLELHKIIAPDKSYYAIRTCVAKYKAQETPIASVTLNLDGNDYPLTPIADARKEELLGAVQEWFVVTDDLLDKLVNTKKISMKITYANGKTRKDEQSNLFVNSIQRLLSITKENYQQQEKIAFAKNDYRIFIPGVNPADLASALIYKVNYETLSKKEQLRSYNYQVSLSPDQKYLAFYNVISRSDGISFCGWLNFQPQENGTWVSLDLLDTNSISGWRKMKTTGDSGIMNLYSASDLVNSIVDAYKLFYGTYDYGFIWEPIIGEKDSKNITRSKWRSGPFVVSSVNTKLFPELVQINKGDVITEINGISTKNMNYMDTLVKIVCSGKKVTFTLKDSLGNQKVVSVQPKFTPTKGNAKNFREIVEKDSRQFVKFDKNRDYPFAFPMSYNPLANGIQ
jgi:hypothetical protein